MFRKLIPAVLGLIVCVQASSSFAGGSFFPHHIHHHHHHGFKNFHHHQGRFISQPFPRVVHHPQFVVIRKWTPYGWVLIKQPIGGAFVRF